MSLEGSQEQLESYSEKRMSSGDSPPLMFPRPISSCLLLAAFEAATKVFWASAVLPDTDGTVMVLQAQVGQL